MFQRSLRQRYLTQRDQVDLLASNGAGSDLGILSLEIGSKLGTVVAAIGLGPKTEVPVLILRKCRVEVLEERPDVRGSADGGGRLVVSVAKTSTDRLLKSRISAESSSLREAGAGSPGQRRACWQRCSKSTGSGSACCFRRRNGRARVLGTARSSTSSQVHHLAREPEERSWARCELQRTSTTLAFCQSLSHEV